LALGQIHECFDQLGVIDGVRGRVVGAGPRWISQEDGVGRVDCLLEGDEGILAGDVFEVCRMEGVAKDTEAA